MKSINYYSLSKKGVKSIKNEDFIKIPTQKIPDKELENKGLFFVLCDGMGGHTAGEIASKSCASSLFEEYYSLNEISNIPFVLINGINNANNKIIGVMQDFPQFKGMGTTLVNLLIHQKKAFINNVGDSRLYLYHNNCFEQITEDQSPAWESYKSGIITKDELILYKYKNLISEAIGIHKNPIINSYQLDLPDKFTFLLCSDGLTDNCTDHEINKIIYSCNSLQACARKLYDFAIKKGSLDDISIILVSNQIEK